VYLVPPSSSTEFYLSDQSREYFEVKPRTKNVKELIERLQKTLQTDNHLSSAELLSEFILSEKETLELLPALGGFLDSENKIVTFPKLMIREGFRQLFDAIIQNCLSLKNLRKADLLSSFTGERNCFDFLLKCLSVQEDGNHESFSFDPTRVARVGALLVLFAHKGVRTTNNNTALSSYVLLIFSLLSRILEFREREIPLGMEYLHPRG
jgi:hypothetical protein